jgi:hypothetical protein
MAHASNLNTQEAEVGGSKGQGQPGLPSKPLSERTNQEIQALHILDFSGCLLTNSDQTFGTGMPHG